MTGIGVVAPGGATREVFWSALVSGTPATRRLTFFDATGFRSQVAAECDFDPYAAGLDEHETRRVDRHIQLGLAAALEAMRDSGLDLARLDHNRLAVSLGSALGSVTRLEEEYVGLSNRGREWMVDPGYAGPFLDRALDASNLAAEVALRFDAHGPASVVATSSTAGIDAVGHGHQLIADGEADVVLAGAAEAPITPIVLAALDPIKATSHRNDDPAHASRPFDRDRDGFVLGEGAAVLILEEMGLARARDARIYGEVVGFARRGNAYHMTGLPRDGQDLADAIGDALAQANLTPADVDYVCAHGIGSKQSDRHETAAYRQALGDRALQVPISSIKSMIGHALGSSGALAAAACALALEQGIVPPTVNLDNRDPDLDLDYVARQAREKRMEVALTTASGFGGFQSALLLARL